MVNKNTGYSVKLPEFSCSFVSHITEVVRIHLTQMPKPSLYCLIEKKRELIDFYNYKGQNTDSDITVFRDTNKITRILSCSIFQLCFFLQCLFRQCLSYVIKNIVLVAPGRHYFYNQGKNYLLGVTLAWNFHVFLPEVNHYS